MVSKEARNYVAKEIEQYHATKREIETIEEDIIFQRTYSGSRDSVTSAVSIIVSHRALRRMIDFVDTFEDVYNRLTEDKKEALRLLYWNSKDFNCNGVGMQIGVDGSTVGRWRISILNEIAERMGLK